MRFFIHEIQKQDDPAVESLIRTCLKEFHADHEGTAWADPDLCRFSEIYKGDGRKYWVALNEDGKLIAGTGIGPVEGMAGISELQKMYCEKEYRGSGASHLLMNTALDYAEQYYDSCYLETLDNMTAAQRFYEKYGFERINEPLGNTGHYACDVRYLKKL